MWHLLKLRVLKTVPEGRVGTDVTEEAGCYHQLANQARMPDRHLQRDRAAVAEAENICLFDVEVLDECSRIIGGLLEAEGSIRNVRGMTESLLLKRYDLPTAREFRKQVTE